MMEEPDLAGQRLNNMGWSRVPRGGVLVILALLVLGIGPTCVMGQDAELQPFSFTQVNAAAPVVQILALDRETGTKQAIQGRRLLTDSREIYLSSATVATLFQGTRFWDGRLGNLDLKTGGLNFRFTQGTRLVQSPAGETLLPIPVLLFQDDLWLPLEAVVAVMAPELGSRVSWDPDQHHLTLGVEDKNITKITTEILGRTTVVHVVCSEPLGYRATGTRDGNIELKIYGGRLAPRVASRVRPRGLLQGMAGRQGSDSATLTLSVDDLVGHFRTYTADDGKDIVVVLEEEQVSMLPEPVPRGRVDVNIPSGPVDVTHDLKVTTVVIDPGHGGHDMGAVGPDGIMEKDVNLAVARELRSYLRRESNLKVVLTRGNDEFIELDDRAELANTTGGNLFISLHCNSWFNNSARGLETYFLSPARSDWARSVASAENGAGADGQLDVPDDVEFIVWELVQNRFISSSSHLAEVIQDQVSDSLGLVDRGVHQAGFRVLVGAYMPAVLVEMGFLSNPREERKLGESGYQRRVAKAIGDAILSYREEMAQLQGTGSGLEVGHGR